MRPSGNPDWSKTPITTARLKAIEDALKNFETVDALPANSLAGQVKRLSTDGQLYLDTGAAWLRVFVADANGNLKFTGTSIDEFRLIFERSDGGLNEKLWALQVDSTHGFSLVQLNDDGTLRRTVFKAGNDTVARFAAWTGVDHNDWSAAKAPNETPSEWYVARISNAPSGYPAAYGNVIGHTNGSNDYQYSFQIFKGNDGPLYIRQATSATTWGSWYQFGPNATGDWGTITATATNANQLGGQTLTQVKNHAVAMALALG